MGHQVLDRNAHLMDEERNLYLDRPMKGKTPEQLEKHTLKTNLEQKPIERALFILATGDVAQKISVVQSLLQLISLDSGAVYNRIVPKIKQDLPNAPFELQQATSATFKLLLKKTGNTNVLQTIIQGIATKDQNISIAWAEALFTNISNLPEIVVQTYLLPLVAEKFQAKTSVQSRIFCAKLVGEICAQTKFRLLDVKRDIMPTVIGLCQDVSIEVRIQMCIHLPKVAALLRNYDTEKSNLLSCIVELTQDGNENVQSASVIAVIAMMTISSDEINRNTLLPLMKQLCKKACSDSLHIAYTVSDEFNALMHVLPPLNAEDVIFFVCIYTQLSLKGKQGANLKANAALEVNIRQKCATNIGGLLHLVLHIPSLVNEVYEVFREHVIDPCYLVRRASAGVSAEVALLLGMYLCLSIGSQNKIMKNETVRLLRDDTVDVLEKLVPGLSIVLTSFTVSGLLSQTEVSQNTIELCKALNKCQNELAKRYNWRLSVEFIKQLEVLPICMPDHYIHSNFTPIVLDKLVRGKSKPVKMQAARTLIVFLRYNFKPNQQKWLQDSLVIHTALSRSCYNRILFFSMCEAVLAIFSEKYFKAFFLNACLALAGDKVIGVRYRFVQFSSQLKSMVTLAKDVATKQLIIDTTVKMELMEKNQTVLEIIKLKKREAPPKYLPEQLKEEDSRVKAEQTNIIKSPTLTPTEAITTRVAVTISPAAQQNKIHFLKQHFYTDTGVMLERILDTERISEYENAALNTIDLIDIECCNITDDAKINLKEMRSKLTPPSFTTHLSSTRGLVPTRNKRYSSIISADCLDYSKIQNQLSQKRYSLTGLNPHYYCESKIPVPTWNKATTTRKNKIKYVTAHNIVDNRDSLSEYKYVTSRTPRAIVNQQVPDKIVSTVHQSQPTTPRRLTQTGIVVPPTTVRTKTH